uniref:Uncharacterized protein n=1 Tax=Plectus sambesii TaxID=2011161 RepID=A0A914UIA0_9BILA
MGYCKANYLFVNFEVRTTDRYQLPYTNRELFHLTQVCDELFVTLVPSLDLNSSYIDANAAKAIIDRFLDDFPLSKVAHFGPNLTSILIEHRAILDAVQKRAKKLYLSLDVDDRNGQLVDSLPPYVTLCVEGRYPLDIEAHLSPKINVVLKFATSDVGYLCQAPESTVRNAVLAAKLGEKVPIHGTMICELSTGCEIMPPSLAYVPEIATLGVSWNRDVDMKRFCYLLPRITAEHVLLDGKMTALFQQAMTLGRVEHELTKLGAGLLRTGSAGSPSSIPNGVGPKKPPISVFVEMILNPDNMTLERLTPVAFKKSRIELRRSLKALDETRKELPYNFELALVLAEVQLVSELMALASRLGQALCIHGGNPTTNGDHHVGLSTINVGVANLPLTVRTDLANSLLEIRSKFQHTWLSRNIPSTLPNALKIFDNLFRALLPPSMQDYSKNLL